MKTRLLMIASIVFAAFSMRAAESIDIDQLPAPVNKALTASGISASVKEVTIRSIGGRTVYDVEVERKNAVNARLRVAADGTVIRDSRQPLSDEEFARRVAVASSGEYGVPLYLPKLKFEDLPASVQQAVTKEAAGRQISDIKPDTVNGRKAYLVEFQERGRNPRLYVGEDGALLRPEEKPPALLFGTTFVDTPRAVQETIRREVGDQEIVKIDKRSLGREPNIYTVEIKGKEGVFELRIAEDGRIVKDSRGDTNPATRK